MTGYGLDNRGSIPEKSKRFLFVAASERAPWSKQLALRTLFPGAMRQERQANHLLLSSAEVKKEWTYISTTQYVSMA